MTFRPGCRAGCACHDEVPVLYPRYATAGLCDAAAVSDLEALRDRMRQIQEELGEQDDNAEIDELRKKIDDSKMNDEVRAVAKKQLSRMSQMASSSPEYNIARTYVENLLENLEIHYLANRDPNILFALLTDFPDAPAREAPNDYLLEKCVRGIEGLNARYSSARHSPFYLFHRAREWNPSEDRWMGHERKRGKLNDFNEYLLGRGDTFHTRIGDLESAKNIRFVITLDSDTQLPRDTARKLIGAMAHPLNQAVVDPATHMVVDGYGILQPRMGISVQSAARSRLAALYSGQTGFDIYTRATSDVYQDLFGEGIFTGKGIYEVDTFQQVLDLRFPCNAVLSHDLLEGSYTRAGLLSDVEVIDDYPSHVSAYSRRKHRWVRGDWQIIRWLLPQVPDRAGNMVHNPLNSISR